MRKAASAPRKADSVISNVLVETHLSGRFKSVGLEERRKHYCNPGASITIVNAGKIEWSKGFGYKNIATREKVEADTMFLAGSISKPVFALAVVKLVETGKLDLDRDVNDYLKSWKIPKNGAWQPRITMRQLLSHTAGLTVQGFPGYRQSDAIPSTVQILKGVRPANTDPVVVNILPGTMMRYSGGGVTVAQLVLEDVFGEPFSEIIQEVLFKPLDLTSSTYSQALSKKYKRRIAHGYPSYHKEIQGGYHIYPEMAAAGLWTNGHDLAVLMCELQKALNGQKSFFEKKGVEAMLSPQKIAKNIGFGFFLEGVGAAERFYHNGWDEGFVAKFISYKQGGQGAVILLNSNSGQPLIDEILRSIAREYGWKDYLTPKAKAVSIDPGSLMEYCGSYITETGLEFNVRGVDGGVELELEGQPPVEILPGSKTEFFSSIINLKVQFEFNKNGKVELLSIIQGGNAIKAKKRSK
ncbi:MAG: serine hydrolase [Victivallaceae bacterium]